MIDCLVVCERQDEVIDALKQSSCNDHVRLLTCTEEDLKCCQQAEIALVHPGMVRLMFYSQYLLLFCEKFIYLVEEMLAKHKDLNFSSLFPQLRWIQSTWAGVEKIVDFCQRNQIDSHSLPPISRFAGDASDYGCVFVCNCPFLSSK